VVLQILRRYGIGALCLVAIIIIARSSLDPDQYFSYHPEEPAKPIVNPIAGVAFIVAVLSAEAAVLYFLLRPWQPGWPWHRALAAFLVFSGWLFLCTLVVVHAPGFVLLHAIWVFALVVGLALNLLGSVIWSFRHRRRSAHSATKAAG